MFDARDCMFWWGAQLGMAALEFGPLGRYAFSSAGGDRLGHVPGRGRTPTDN